MCLRLVQVHGCEAANTVVQASACGGCHICVCCGRGHVSVEYLRPHASVASSEMEMVGCMEPAGLGGQKWSEMVVHAFTWCKTSQR